MTIISAIVAMSENRVIGDDNHLPWHLPADLKFFKKITSGNPILMGRKTFESIGKPLPNRTNIIMTRNVDFKAPGCVLITSIEQVLELAESNDHEELFIIGGAEIYRLLLPMTQRIYLTLVHEQVEGDTFFPELSMHEWKQVSSEYHAADEENEFAFSFIMLERLG